MPLELMQFPTFAPSTGAAQPRDEAQRGPRPSVPRALLEAKLVVPRTRPGIVGRTRLLGRLRSARNRQVVSIVAPPGYGKTSLLVQWAASGFRSVAWLTADEGDNDPMVFLTYLAAAIDRVAPLDPSIFTAIASPVVSSRTVVGRLLAVISERAEPVLIAIDDVHRITDRACVDALAEFIAYLPQGSQVAIAGRELVALPIARWRAEGSVLEFGPDDLTMDEREAAELVRHLGPPLSAEATSQLTREAEGWPALLALAALAARRPTDRDARTALGRDRGVANYLRSELLEQRPEDEIAFLTRTSILERLSGPVCDVVADRPGSADLLARLGRSTLLVDEYGGSYRYHTLVRDFLRAQLEAREPERIAALHRRAAVWYDASGVIELAVDHAFAAGDLDLAATLAGRGMLRYHWSGRRATTRAWFRRFGDEALQEHPWLAVLAAWEEVSTGDVASTVHLADIAERGTFEGTPPDGTASFESGRAMLRAGMVRRGADDALANAARGVELEGAGSPWRDFALWQLAVARLTLGDQEGADVALSDAVEAAKAARNVVPCHGLLGHRALLALDRGDWVAAAAFADESDAIAPAAMLDGYLSGAPSRAAHIRLAIQRGDIAGARRDLAHAMGLRPVLTAAHPAAAVQCLLAFARAHLAVGDTPGASTILEQATHVVRLRPDLGVLPDAVAALRSAIASQEPTRLLGASSLTVAELRVLALLPYYLSFKEIGQRLGVKVTTVRTQAVAIYGKLEASTRSEAVDRAVEAGLLERFLPGPSPSYIREDAAQRAT